MKEISVFVEFVDAKLLNETLSEIKKMEIEMESISISKSQSNLSNGIGIEMLVHIHKKKDADVFVGQLNALENVHFAIRTTY